MYDSVIHHLRLHCVLTTQSQASFCHQAFDPLYPCPPPPFPLSAALSSCLCVLLVKGASVCHEEFTPRALRGEIRHDSVLCCRLGILLLHERLSVCLRPFELGSRYFI